MSLDSSIDTTISKNDTVTSIISIADCVAMSDAHGHTSETIGSGSATNTKSGGYSMSKDSDFIVEYRPALDNGSRKSDETSGIEIASGGATHGGKGSMDRNSNGHGGGAHTHDGGWPITTGGNTAGRKVEGHTVHGGGAPAVTGGMPITNGGSTIGRIVAV